MNYWRMQLHPEDPERSVQYASQSLTAGFIGLGFATEVGDLEFEDESRIPVHQRDYRAFANEMNVGDRVLIIAHHFPFGVCTVTGPYNYIKNVEPKLGVWFNHFRRVNEIRFFADYRTNAQTWEPIKMTDTISPLRNDRTLSLALLREMYGET